MKAMLEPRMVAANTHGRARSAQPDVSYSYWGNERVTHGSLP